MKKIFYLLLWSLFLCQTWLHAKSSVWKVTSNDKSIYIGGTSHLLRQKDYPLPVEYEWAFKQADWVVFETDIGELSGPDTQERILSQAMYKGDKTIKDDLSPVVYDSLVAVCDRLNFPLSSCIKLKPFMLMISLMTQELQNNEVMEIGVDQYFYNRAVADSLEVGWLETIDEQLNAISFAGNEDEDTFVKYSLIDMNRTSTMFEDMVKAWRSGNENNLDELFVGPIKQEMPSLYEELFVNRNNSWIPQIEQFFKSDKTVFVLVGVGHLVGEDSVLFQLQKKGYKIEKLDKQEESL